MLIKVCGMREAQNIRDVESLGVDMMGFICWPHRKSRYVECPPSYLPQCQRVGVFVNADCKFIADKCNQLGLTHIQLHGDETPDFCSKIKSITNKKIIKAIKVCQPDDINEAKRYDGIADYILFDTKTKYEGGSGQKFNWKILDFYQGNTPFFVAGGIGPEDASEIRHIKHSQFAGVDLNSKFEVTPALKNINLLKTFICELRK